MTSIHFPFNLSLKRALFFAFFLFMSLVFLQNQGFLSLSALAAETTDDLDDALKDGKKTIHFSGKESNDVKIRPGVSVIGTSPDKAIINGDVVMENGSSLENVTVNGDVNVVTVEKGASVTLSNVSLRGGTQAGIYAPGGGGTVTVKNSRIFKNRKGLYVLSGKAVALSGNSITENDEEGADFHASISGSISGNTFSQNGEGGMEIIINGSSLTLSNNKFLGNKASGLALQTYKGEEKTGKFTVQNNTFSGNGNFGIDCKNPQGSGNTAYFLSSVTAIGNNLSGNKIGQISPVCRFNNQSDLPKESEVSPSEESKEIPQEVKTEPVQEKPVEVAPPEGTPQEVVSEEIKNENPAPNQSAWQSVKDFAKNPISFLFPSAWREKLGGFLSSVHW